MSTHPVHLGSILNDNFLEPRHFPTYRPVLAIGVPNSALECFRTGRTTVTTDLANRLSDYFDTKPEYWLNSQVELDMHVSA